MSNIDVADVMVQDELPLRDMVIRMKVLAFVLSVEVRKDSII